MHRGPGQCDEDRRTSGTEKDESRLGAFCRIVGRRARRHAELAAEVQALKSGLDAVEARARTELGMIKNGETFYLVVDSRNDESDRPLSADSARSDGTRDDALPRPAQ